MSQERMKQKAIAMGWTVAGEENGYLRLSSPPYDLHLMTSSYVISVEHGGELDEFQRYDLEEVPSPEEIAELVAQAASS